MYSFNIAAAILLGGILNGMIFPAKDVSPETTADNLTNKWQFW